MFGDYVYEQASAQYTDRILLIDSDNLEEQTHYSADFLAHDFDVLYYIDDLQFRIKYQEMLESSDKKLAVLVKPNMYVPYDIQRRLRSYSVSFAKLFPNLDAATLREKRNLDLNLLCLAYKKNFINLRSRKMTEQFIDEVVYEKNNISQYIKALLPDALKGAENAQNYSDWFAVAEKKAQIDVLSVAYSIPTYTNLINEPAVYQYR